ncbi:hypothetical protein JD844_005180 [Phrynosoma platyrhinos]|uniref:Fibronectin type-III domain-containing protein n=1 Tax=Phrynosoma platyrhinos TaxID=52577 RepID=A0ABQ7TN24_PHRPL|nr:hypothetical protein JD844_005180 [Phrynosoma platyrhinos]
MVSFGPGLRNIIRGSRTDEKKIDASDGAVPKQEEAKQMGSVQGDKAAMQPLRKTVPSHSSGASLQQGERSRQSGLLAGYSPSAPVNVSVKLLNANSAVVTWDVLEEEVVIGFAISQQEVNTTTRSCSLWDLEEDTEYIVHVQSISIQGQSPASEPFIFKTPREAEKLASKNKGKQEGGWVLAISLSQDSVVAHFCTHAHCPPGPQYQYLPPTQSLNCQHL